MNKTAVVVGASRGIGRSIVEQLAAIDGMFVHALSRDQEKMNSAFGHLKNVKCHPFDLSSNVRQQAREIFASVGSIDLLINNAGKLVNKPFTSLTHDEIEGCYQTNVIGVMETVQAAVEYISSGHIVNISSMGGFQGSVKFPGLSAYSTSKAAVCSFTELFAEEYKDTDIKMNCLCLGAAQTEMLEEAFPGYKAPLSANEMAEFIVDFAINAHRYLNGKIIPVSLSTP